MLEGKTSDRYVRINIDEPGVYVFDTESATGKTFLKVLLDRLKYSGKPVDTYSFDKLRDGLKLSSVLENKDTDIVLIDRYDRFYSNILNKEIDNASTRKIILIDYKGLNSINGHERNCSITLTDRCIEVNGF